MHMADYVEHLDRILVATGKPVLAGAGKISHKQAVDKATSEYRKFQKQTISPVEKDYLKTINRIESEARRVSKRATD
ncbi:RhuM family protein [Arcanobacterium phocae]|uniref:RhuM family protein n=2 Tax=Arcanobacterium phocae TaxID=131112 RepID=UPI00209EDEF3|nr:RhuM family protein [Arcanobacterium phocae]